MIGIFAAILTGPGGITYSENCFVLENCGTMLGLVTTSSLSVPPKIRCRLEQEEDTMGCGLTVSLLPLCRTLPCNIWRILAFLADLNHGRSQRCDTFDNEPLSGEKEDFIVQFIEAFGFRM